MGWPISTNSTTTSAGAPWCTTMAGRHRPWRSSRNTTSCLRTHGSDYYGMRQQRIANLQTPLRDRRRICGQIIGNYYEARELGALTDPNGPQPNMDILLACYRASAESVRNGSNRYAIDRAMLGLDDQPSTDFTADLEEPVW